MAMVLLLFLLFVVRCSLFFVVRCLLFVVFVVVVRCSFFGDTAAVVAVVVCWKYRNALFQIRKDSASGKHGR